MEKSPDMRLSKDPITDTLNLIKNVSIRSSDDIFPVSACRYNLAYLCSVFQYLLARRLVGLYPAALDVSGLNPFNPYSLIVLNKRNFAI